MAKYKLLKDLPTFKAGDLFYISQSWQDAGESVRYETREDAEKSIKENREDWLIYFGIREGE